MAWWSKRLYRGDINRLVIVAAPSGAGKSTFLENSAAMLDGADLPAGLEDLHEIAPHYKTIGELKKAREDRFDKLCLHVDLSRPLRKLNRQAANRNELIAKLTAQVYSNWRDLTAYTRQAAEVHVVTMFVRREAHYRRWIERAKQRNAFRKLKTALAVINSDLTNGSELHRKAYQAWNQFVASIRANTTHILDVNSKEYSFLAQADFDDEINFGYAENETILKFDRSEKMPQTPLADDYRRSMRRAA